MAVCRQSVVSSKPATHPQGSSEPTTSTSTPSAVVIPKVLSIGAYDRLKKHATKLSSAVQGLEVQFGESEVKGTPKRTRTEDSLTDEAFKKQSALTVKRNPVGSNGRAERLTSISWSPSTTWPRLMENISPQLRSLSSTWEH